ncbi:MAG: DUF4276 family protein [Desulfovibrionales bacterium]|nr:MAG: DUF4276 family protein [Desulfovibrionales bacterium]
MLVEEASAEEALRHVLPGLLRSRARAKVINLGSKYKLLKVIENRLRAYRTRIDKGEDLRIVVLLDRDDDDCVLLKGWLEQAAATAGLPSKSRPDEHGRFFVVNRIVVEELESWFIGDTEELRRAFTGLPRINPNGGIFRNPDNGGTWEALHRFLKKHGIYRNSYPKIDAARRIDPNMRVDRNRSGSFGQFVAGIEAVLA